MATGIEQLPSGKWRADITLDGRRHRSEALPTAKAAKQWRAAMQADHYAGKFVDPKLGKTTLAEWSQKWLAKKAGEVADNTLDAYRYRLSLLPEQETRLSAITEFDVERWRNIVAGQVSASTAKAVVSTLKSCLADAVKAKMLNESPAENVDHLKVARKKIEALTVAEFEAICEVAPPWVEHVARGLVWLGCRSSDLREITRDDIIMGRHLRVGDIKTKAEDRYLPIGALELGEDEYLFPNEDGGQLNMDRFRVAWRSAVKDAGIGRTVRPHDLRHTCASWMLEAGSTVVQVQKWLGHANATITLDTYSHMMPGGLEVAAERFAAFLSDGPRRAHEGPNTGAQGGLEAI